jgi:hypothetical protein
MPRELAQFGIYQTIFHGTFQKIPSQNVLCCSNNDFGYALKCMLTVC